MLFSYIVVIRVFGSSGYSKSKRMLDKICSSVGTLVCVRERERECVCVRVCVSVCVSMCVSVCVCTICVKYSLAHCK